MNKAESLRKISEDNKIPMETIIKNLEGIAKSGQTQMRYFDANFSHRDIQGFNIAQSKGFSGENITTISW